MLLEAARERGIRHLQVSTDEVYGSIAQGSFTEDSPLRPSSPYSATKAGADLLVGSYHETFGADVVICRGSNNYGPRQHPEKLIPLMVLNAIAGDPLPVYGDGLNVRNWLFVEDFAARDRPCPAPRRRRRGLQRRRARRVLEHRGRAAHPRVERARRVADRVRQPTGPGTTAATRWARRRWGSSAGRRACTSPRASSGRSPGIARTRGGGSRSAAAPTASTTSASTAGGSRLRAPEDARQAPAAATRGAACTVLMTLVPLFSVCTVAVGLRAVHDDRLDRQREVADRLQLAVTSVVHLVVFAQRLHDRRVEHVLADVRRIGAARVAGEAG